MSLTFQKTGPGQNLLPGRKKSLTVAARCSDEDAPVRRRWGTRRPSFELNLDLPGNLHDVLRR
jgi:hypothetical protein